MTELSAQPDQVSVLGKLSSLFLVALLITFVCCIGVLLLAILRRCQDMAQCSIAKSSSSECVFLRGSQPTTILVLDQRWVSLLVVDIVDANICAGFKDPVYVR
jgi:hypothetical protein